MGESISNTHEWRRLDEFQQLDKIHRWGDDLEVVAVHHLESGILLYYLDTDGEEKSITGEDDAQYIARKREVSDVEVRRESNRILKGEYTLP